MNTDEFLDLPGTDHPVLCADGKYGMLLVFPVHDAKCGIQVPGEEEHRWIDAADLIAGPGGALRQGSAEQPPLLSLDIAQALLAMDWDSKGGC